MDVVAEVARQILEEALEDAKAEPESENKVTKGQLISKANFLVLIWANNLTKLFFDFCPSL